MTHRGTLMEGLQWCTLILKRLSWTQFVTTGVGDGMILVNLDEDTCWWGRVYSVGCPKQVLESVARQPSPQYIRPPLEPGWGWVQTTSPLDDGSYLDMRWGCIAEQILTSASPLSQAKERSWCRLMPAMLTRYAGERYSPVVSVIDTLLYQRLCKAMRSQQLVCLVGCLAVCRHVSIYRPLPQQSTIPLFCRA